MSQPVAVIGANFGDEGKGLVTDYVVSQAKGDVLVVRYNGGAQAGHTVITPEGIRHVFHHFGSGTLLGAATYLSRFFIVNPILWKKERDELRRIGAPELKLWVDPRALITTPYDMLVNQEIERIRNNWRYGSCGLGIHETQARNAKFIGTNVGHSDIKGACEQIRRDWAEQRVYEMTEERPSSLFRERIKSDTLLYNYLNDFDEFLAAVNFTETLPGAENVVFEGAQGLLLDENHPFFPFVTQSDSHEVREFEERRAATGPNRR